MRTVVRSTVAVVFVQFLCLFIHAQEIPTTNDSTAATLIASMMEQAGWGSVRPSACAKVQGYVVEAGGTQQLPFVAKYKGTRKYRSEVQGEVLVINDVAGAFIKDSGVETVRLNAAATSIPPILAFFAPALRSPDSSFAIVGTKRFGADEATGIEIRPSPPTSDKYRAVKVKTDVITVWISAANEVASRHRIRPPWCSQSQLQSPDTLDVRRLQVSEWDPHSVHAIRVCR